MRITNREFGGERPKRNSRNLNDNEAQLALDCVLTSTGIRALRSNLFVTRVGVNAKTIYFFENTWLGFEQSVNVIESAPGVSEPRLYWSDDGAPKQATALDITRGISNRLGIPTPVAPIIVDVLDARSALLPDVTSLYVATFVNKYGEEGDFSEPSELFNFQQDRQRISVSGLGRAGANADLLLPYGDIVSHRLYRLDEGEARFVVELLLSETTYIDVTATTVLGEAVSTNDFVPPPEALQGLHLMGNGSAVGFIGKTVYVSEPYQLYAWPYSFPVQSNIVAISSFDNTMVILTTGYPEVASFYDPANISPSILTNRQPCASFESVVQASGGVIYATPSNLYFIGPSGGQSLTDEFFSDREFAGLKPETFNAVFRDGEYYAFHEGDAEGNCLVFDTREANAVVRQLSQTADAVHVKRGTDELYLGIGTNIEQFEGGTKRVKYVWESKEHGLANPTAMISARVISQDFLHRLSDDEIARIDKLHDDAVATNKIALTARAKVSIANGYGGAINQDTLCGAGFYEVPGLTGVSHPKGAAIANGVDVRVPNAAVVFSVDVSIYGDDELVDTTSVDREQVYRLSYSDRNRRWRYRLAGDTDIEQFDMAGSSSELHDGS